MLKNLEYDALLVHTMGNEGNRVNDRQLLNIEAALVIQQELSVPLLVFAGAHFYGQPVINSQTDTLEIDQQPLAVMAARETVHQLMGSNPFNYPDIIALMTWHDKGLRSQRYRPVVDTRGEVDAFLQYMGQREPKTPIHNLRLASVAAETHMASIRDLYFQRHIPAHVYGAEATLQTVADQDNWHRYQNIIAEYHRSGDEQNFTRRERIKQVVYFAMGSVGERLIQLQAERQRQVVKTPQDIYNYHPLTFPALEGVLAPSSDLAVPDWDE